jgi:bifunctional NMN adenylyltransferase/nudix hydrolase
MTNTLKSVGVVVGRFQVAELHAGHRHLLETARCRHDALLVLIGTTNASPTPRNPLSYKARRFMLEAAFPEATILPVSDHPSDEAWSTKIDALITETFPDAVATLYGSRDSFAPRYSGVLPIEIIDPIPSPCGTDTRNGLMSDIALTSSEIRGGIIRGVTERFPITYPTVDVAIMRGTKVLLGRKASDPAGKYRFIGGFVDPSDESLEAAAKREAYEETSGMEIGDLRYVGSAKVEDWRYRGTGDGIMTTLFRATYVFGALAPADDIEHLEWHTISDLPDVLVPEHLRLGELLADDLSR